MDDSGLANRVARMTKASIGFVIVESAVFFENGQRCPLMDLGEEMGSEHGDVGEYFPAELARQAYPDCFFYAGCDWPRGDWVASFSSAATPVRWVNYLT